MCGMTSRQATTGRAGSSVVELAGATACIIQMGYMFRYHHGFRQIAEWARGGLLGDVFSVRAHMSTRLTIAQREVISEHTGGIFYDLAGHMLDQIVWILGRPQHVSAVLRNDSGLRAGLYGQYAGRIRVRTRHRVRGHRGDGDAADGAALRGLWHRRQRHFAGAV